MVDPASAPVRVRSRAAAARAALAREVGKFGIIGAVAFVVDVGLFNLLRWGAADGVGPLADSPLTAKVVSAFTATVVAWAGNRWWTFRARRQPGVLRELVLFVAMNGVAVVISLVCLAFSHYVLGLRSAVADNVSANIIGVGLGTLFRFYAYRTWVFRKDRTAAAGPDGGVDAVDAVDGDGGAGGRGGAGATEAPEPSPAARASATSPAG